MVCGSFRFFCAEGKWSFLSLFHSLPGGCGSLGGTAGTCCLKEKGMIADGGH